jgi:hypothetical protein
MGFLEAYILISVLGLFSHKIIRKYRPKNKAMAAYYSVLAFGIPLFIGIMLYVGTFNWMFPISGFESGKDYMFNGFLIFRVGSIPMSSSGLGLVAAILFLSYIPWYVYIKDGSRMLFGQKSYQSGYWWAFKPNKVPKMKEEKKPEEPRKE